MFKMLTGRLPCHFHCGSLTLVKTGWLGSGEGSNQRTCSTELESLPIFIEIPIFIISWKIFQLYLTNFAFAYVIVHRAFFLAKTAKRALLSFGILARGFADQQRKKALQPLHHSFSTPEAYMSDDHLSFAGNEVAPSYPFSNCLSENNKGESKNMFLDYQDELFKRGLVRTKLQVQNAASSCAKLIHARYY